AGAGEGVYCAGSDRYKPVPAPKVEPKAVAKVEPKADGLAEKPKEKEKEKEAEDEVKPKKSYSGTPERMLVPGVGDMLKDTTRGKGKVFGLSLKDRSAILPAGKRPDGAYWFNGQFTTSTYYRDQVPSWVEAFNRSGVADRWFGTMWERSRPALDYTAIVGPDDGPGEGKGANQGITFPHPMTGGKPAISKSYYEALANSPFGNDLLLEFAKECITAERLGQDDVPDLLTISFSSNDLVGHTWGPDSHEVFDTTLRSDRIVAELLKFLDAKIGVGNYVVALTADHGVCPLPEAALRQGIDAKRVDPGKIRSTIENALNAKYGKDPSAKPVKWIEAMSSAWIYFNRRVLAARGVSIEAVTQTASEAVQVLPDVMSGVIPNRIDDQDPTERRIRRAMYPNRTGDLYILLKPYRIPSDPVKGTGTTHGSPHAYDTHVPLLIYGPASIRPGVHDEPVTPEHAASIFSTFLGTPPPPDALEFPLPERFWR
ncbi:MAG: alkaline phosphatase family protein, partial [Gemmataceae bacterium]